MAIPVGVPRVRVSSGQPLTGPGGTLRRGHFVFTGPGLVTIQGEEYTLGGSEPAYLVDGVLTVDLVPSDVPTMNPAVRLRTALTRSPVCSCSPAVNQARQPLMSRSHPLMMRFSVALSSVSSFIRPSPW